MENYIRELTMSLGKLDSRHVRMILVLITIILFVLGAGAPGDFGGFGV